MSYRVVDSQAGDNGEIIRDLKGIYELAARDKTAT